MPSSTSRGCRGSQSLFRCLTQRGSFLLLIALLLTAATSSFASTPFYGTPIAVPGTINAVDYDKGTSGDAYFIQQAAASGGYRADDASGPVPINPTNAYGAPTGVVGTTGYMVGNHIVQGDWLIYTISVASTGLYDFSVNCGTAQSTRSIDVQVDGTDVTPGNVVMVGTGGWNQYGNTTYPSVPLTSGTHKMKILVSDVNAIYCLSSYTFTAHVVKTYYVSSSGGNDNNNGTSTSTPFATIAKAESIQLNPGDSVLFKRGDTWHEVLNPICNGTSTNPITFADYGTGNKPKFWGSDPIPVNSGWTSAGGNVYTRPYATQVNSVLVNQQFMIDIFNGGTGDGSVARDPSNTPNCWKWSGGVLTISTNGTNPNSDGRQYDACVRDNVICNGSQQQNNFDNYLTFTNLVVDECGSNNNPTLGYGIRIQGQSAAPSGTNPPNQGIGITVTSCEVYRYGRHAYAVIDGTQATFNSDYCAYPMPNEQTGQTGYVSFGNTCKGLSETSVYNNCVAEHQADTWAGRNDFEYEAFTDHGESLQSVIVNNLQAIDGGGDGTGDNCSFDGASGAIVNVKGGTCYSAQVNTLGPNVTLDGMKITGPFASLDMSSIGAIVQNCVIAGTTSASPYNSAVWDRQDANIFRNNTVVLGSTAGTGFSAVCLATLNTNIGTNFKMYGNIIMPVVNGHAVISFDSRDSFDAANYRYNVYQSGSLFNWNYAGDQNLAAWQSGHAWDANSITTASIGFNNPGAGDYSLTSGSPAVNFEPTSVAHPSTDILGASRPSGSGIDAGAYEFGGAAPAAPVITSPGTASGTAGTAFSYQITATNGPTSYGASSLPAGTSVNTGTGLISGTPSASGTSNATVTATNSGGTGSQAVTITINPSVPVAPVITSAGSANGQVGVAFSYQITASNSPTSYGASSLPAGTSVNTGNGLVSGTPTTAATYNSSVTATNAGGTGSKAVTITISASGGATPFNINAFFTLGTTVTNGGADNGGNAYESNLLGTTATYNGSTFTFGPANSVDAWNNLTVNLPAGTYTTLNMLGSAVQGNVTAQTFTVHYTDGTSSVFTQNMHDWENNGSYAGETLVVTMANHLNSAGAVTAPACYVHGYTFALTGHAVQSITLPSSRQVLAFGFAAGGVVSAPVITSSLTSSGTVSSAYSYTITATNSPTSYNATSLPAGLTVNTGTGAITGTPTTPGIYSVGISATNAGGTGSATLTLTINGTTTPFNIFAIFTVGTAPTNGGADNGSNAYDSNLLGTTATFNSSSFTYGAANVADAWNNTTVNLPPGTYTTLNMIGTAVQGNVTAQTFTVHYTDGTTSVFTQNMHDWKSSGAYTGETTVSTQANQIISTGAATTPATYVHGYTFTLSGHSVQSITLPATRQVLAFGFAGR